MGNRPTRSKPTSDATPSGSKRRKKSSSSKNGDPVRDPQKRMSLPELGGAIPYRSTSRDDEKSPRDVSVTIYRSYRDLGRRKPANFTDGNEPVDYKFYRRSKIERAASAANAPNTLPRNFGRSKSAAYPDRQAMTPNGDVPSFATLPAKESAGILRSGRSSTRSSRGRSRTRSAGSMKRICKYIKSYLYKILFVCIFAYN